MNKKKVLLIGGSLNQTSIVHAVGTQLMDEYDCWYTPFYPDGGLQQALLRVGALDLCIMSGQFLAQTERYLREHNLAIDYGGVRHDYDLVVTTTDLIVQRNIRRKPIVLIQEGMTDPENLMFHLVKALRLPRYLASTASMGLSDAYQMFCVASEGYRDFFIRKGVRREKIAVTGIPNFDNAARFCFNRFPYRGYALVATSDTRETFKRDDRRRFPQVSMLLLTNNSGKAAAVRAGVELVKASHVLLMDADLRGLAAAEIDRAIAAALANPEIDMIILRRVKAGMHARLCRGDVLFSGERIVKTADLLAALAANPSRYQIEIALNRYMLENGKQVYWMPSSARNTLKMHKQGPVRGLAGDVVMVKNLVDRVAAQGLEIPG